MGKKVHSTFVLHRVPAWIDHAICMAAAATNIVVLVMFNLLGYSVGVAGVAAAISVFWSWDGAKVLAVTFYILCVGYNIMISIERYKTKSKEV